MSKTSPNEEQVRYWNDQAGPRWVDYQEMLDRQLQAIGEAAMDALAPAPGESMLDVGCGCGATSLALAEQVGRDGSVTGIDISGTMLARARERATAIGASNVRFEQIDAQTDTLPEAAFDGLYSRFGVMFFEDPTAAFRNLRPSLREGARLGFVCWQPVTDNPWILIPTAAVMQHVELETPPDPEAPGPFAFGNPDRVRDILAKSGFGSVAVDGLRTKMNIGAGGSLDEATEFLMKIGPVARVLAENEDKPELIATIREAVAETLRAHQTGEGVLMDASVWIVTARAT